MIRNTKIITYSVLLTSLIARVSGDDGTFGQFPPGMISEIAGELTNKTMDGIGACGDPKKSNYKLLLYTRQNTLHPVTLTDSNLYHINSKKQKMLIIHGYFSSPTSFSFPALKEAYLIRYDCEVIMLDWSELSRPRLTTAICYLPKVAPLLADTLCRLNMSLKKFHLIGHSLGGQMSGLIGSNAMDLCGQKIGRITAMDPAGLLYPEFPESQRLDKSDAAFVDVIHTNAGEIGYWGNTGHADFYVNCGSIQPGCLKVFDTVHVHVVEHPLAITFCSHFRSVEYMAESIQTEKFRGKPCKTCPLPCFADLLDRTEVIMGEGCPTNVSGAYVLFTKPEPPYALR